MKKKMGVTRLIFVQESKVYPYPPPPPPPHILRTILYKTLWSVLFVIYINLYYWLEVINYYKAEKEEKKTCSIDAHPGIDPGLLV